MDNLSADMIQCKKDGFGCHYGAWKATQEPVKIEPKTTIPEGWRNCEYCGKPFKNKQGKRFCDIGCRNEAYRERDRILKREHARKRRMCEKDGQA